VAASSFLQALTEVINILPRLSQTLRLLWFDSDAFQWSIPNPKAAEQIFSNGFINSGSLYSFDFSTLPSPKDVFFSARYRVFGTVLAPPVFAFLLMLRGWANSPMFLLTNLVLILQLSLMVPGVFFLNSR